MEPVFAGEADDVFEPEIVEPKTHYIYAALFARIQANPKRAGQVVMAKCGKYVGQLSVVTEWDAVTCESCLKKRPADLSQTDTTMLDEPGCAHPGKACSEAHPEDFTDSPNFLEWDRRHYNR